MRRKIGPIVTVLVHAPAHGKALRTRVLDAFARRRSDGAACVAAIGLEPVVTRAFAARKVDRFVVFAGGKPGRHRTAAAVVARTEWAAAAPRARAAADG